jgi:Protein of unknown function (DUF2380)
MNRRQAIAAACGTAWMAASQPVPALAGTAESAAPPLRSLAVLDFELVDEQNNPRTKADQERRLAEATKQLPVELAQRGLYRVIDAAPSAALQRTLRSQQEYLYRCDDCAVQVGRLLGAELVMGTWVQKVSELILNLNVQIVDVKTQQVVFSKSVDLRGNDDESWRRALRYLVRDMAEKRERNPRYGQ